VDLGLVRAAFVRDMESLVAPFDAMLMPTVPCVAPTIAEVDANDDAYFRWNLRALRNCGLMNFMDACAVTLPCHVPGEGPVGLSVCGVAMSDRRTLAVAAAVERALAG
jgi:aspartyl-tRNA(Asn)/glutamyl-tRNA(Gln) amidotransferase subunit A